MNYMMRGIFEAFCSSKNQVIAEIRFNFDEDDFNLSLRLRPGN